MPNKQQAIIWTNADPIHWLIYAALGGDELKTFLGLRTSCDNAGCIHIWMGECKKDETPAHTHRYVHWNTMYEFSKTFHLNVFLMLMISQPLTGPKTARAARYLLAPSFQKLWYLLAPDFQSWKLNYLAINCLGVYKDKHKLQEPLKLTQINLNPAWISNGWLLIHLGIKLI